ncbi:PLP-dependent transferase [Fomitopsis serialis]|uniref:PLP-dependent transferase n=1 Tax=Fomitopsis serialis TaxID=139415 RepID=UPI0020079A76|nr:PLP-dependent transferase [Neoantrodia serialis]KAH9916047.1 PLP-dependent transferase [Neoantrodia serialis]
MSATLMSTNDQRATLGKPVPPFTAHAISVSLPTWDDNVGYEEGDKRVADVMVIGYPRFFIHLSIQKLAAICEQKFGTHGERCLLCPTRKVAEACRAFMIDRSSKTGPAVPVRLVQFLICPEDDVETLNQCIELHIVLFPGDSFPLAKQFFQHAGNCISSRRAERCLAMLGELPGVTGAGIPMPAVSRPPTRVPNRHYSKKSFGRSPPHSPASSHFRNGPFRSPEEALKADEVLSADQSVYLEERYGRNLPLESAVACKRALRRRIAGVLLRDTPNDWSNAGGNEAEIGPSTRGVDNVAEDDVFLFPTGMSAIWHAHQVALAARPAAKSICFGFPYTDTLKILEKWGPGCWFLGNGLDKDIDELEAILEKEAAANPSKPPALALFTEFPSNPLLRCADLSRLRALADKYDFLIVIDETIGNFVNVEVLPYADIVVSSLSKIFSGDANVMGGSMVLNPRGKRYVELKAMVSDLYEDLYFDEDAVFMERNSRDFRRRIQIIDANALAVCSFLYSRSLAASPPPPRTVVKRVYYPKWETPQHYERCRVREGNGLGGLFSVTFTSAAASRAFYDTLSCQKGPSLGTNFTLASPYVILAHYAELEWAAQYGVEQSLVRVSVGMEDREELLKDFEKALQAAEATLDGADA